ncbi:MAG: DNA mismatch repair protein msh6 [Geoglossum simile]|nr:MAG: DNA mismatch repair protein msh6 [Geoglossum simile]
MVKAIQSSPAPLSSIKKSLPSHSQSGPKSQQSILGFFRKKDTGGAPPSNGRTELSSTPVSAQKHTRKPGLAQTLTPAPSSDAVNASSSQEENEIGERMGNGKESLPSPVTPVPDRGNSMRGTRHGARTFASSPPSKRINKTVNYVVSDDEVENDDSFEHIQARPSRGRATKRRIVNLDEDSEGYIQDDIVGQFESDDDMDDFIVPDDSDEETKRSKKRKRLPKTQSQGNTSPLPISPLNNDNLEISTVSTAEQWTYDPKNTQPLRPRSDAATNASTKKPGTDFQKRKAKAHQSEPDQRYPWLADIRDADKNPPGHPDYDPRTVYIPPLAWKEFTPFERQYWEIKQKFWDTIVFFKKGKFYELYENDATIGHQLFDLKLTDRVNMRMVGVPEMSLDHWASQFVAKGFKIARVDQSESALGKEMRERDNGYDKRKPGKDDKIIRRELSCVLTRGTLVDGGMLQDDMSTYCVAIKETTLSSLPLFGISFVDTATGQFFMTEFVDDVDLTNFETFVAQTRPQELLLEKSNISVRALRILKNNTGPTTIWNYLKPSKEFWSADATIREIDASGYFVSEDHDNEEMWPQVLREAKDKEFVMSAFGALLQYLRMLKIERELITIGNFSWYDPIRKTTSLVLDGQTLINLEIFANTVDGGSAGTLFTLLNNCITPFGKRLFRQWVCHPLADIAKINARLNAVDCLNADTTIRDRFTSQMTKLPDLERLISRIHAGSCRAQDFVRVLDGFEQIDYTVNLLQEFNSEGVIGQLISNMPDLDSVLINWKTAFDRNRAREDGILVPERGVEDDFDASQDHIEQILADLESLLKKYRRDLGSTSVVFRDNGKEIYQLEVPVKVKNVPRSWDQMSATQKVKRYYSPELRSLVRQLQEAQETHGQIVKEVAGRFYARFDEHYSVWLAAVKVIAQLDCLIGLAKASSSIGEPSCRPEFFESGRSVIEFEELRHPCMLPSVTDFIPNDVKLGGDAANINLLTGANAAGKSTVLRMTCVAVIMAQLGCYVPCKSARLTPVDRIMSRLGANDNIFAAQSTFFVELSETKKILSEATPRSLVILDELGRGTSSYDGVAVAQAVLHHIATHIGCMGFFATHYHSLPTEFAGHPEIAPKRMQIDVDDDHRRVTFLYKLENGVAEGSFGMHCAAMCGIAAKVIDRAEVAAKEWEHTSKLKESLERARSGVYVPLGMQSDVAWLLREDVTGVDERALGLMMKAIKAL